MPMGVHHGGMSGPSIDVRTWRALVRERVVLHPRVELVPLEEARGRVLAEPVTSPEDVPAVPTSAMDGFAVRREDLRAPGTSTLPVVADLPARPGATPSLPAGAAMRIMTGAPVPDGADAVVEVEATDADPFAAAPRTVAIALEELPVPQRHIRARGEELAVGDHLAGPGDRVGPGLLGVARSLGIEALPVQAPVRVGVVVTGDELDRGTTGSPARTAPPPGTVRESNGLMLASALRADGALPRTAHCGDDPQALRDLLESLEADCDLVVTTGGIGQGAFDVVRAALGPQGTGSSELAHLALRPGGPQGLGRLPAGTPVLHLPGTPVGALVGYHLFVRAVLPGVDSSSQRMPLGEDPGEFRGRRGRHAVLAQPGRRRFGKDGRPVVDVLPGRRLTPYSRADCLVLREPDAPTGQGGDLEVLVLPL